MAPNEVDVFLLENMETPKGLEDLMASMRDGQKHHPCRVHGDFFFHILCSFEMFPLHGKQKYMMVRDGEKGKEVRSEGRRET